VRLYQLTLSGFVGNSCRHLPTCSEYAYEAIARHGLWAGGWMGLFRVIRCGPWGTHGIDRVPDTLVHALALLAHRENAEPAAFLTHGALRFGKLTLKDASLPDTSGFHPPALVCGTG